ncbi:hypothetical protein [Natribacillus halophilus]|uniref:Uncharacterized protein n=1 Tax=Natribacillus halophilus TaxID=549003 RepID=A0A1G8KJL7_9BACI|nr:hypothetical protein [Natribacillus halophilus]SDI43641.1 hypothetical protein SAMN04488123_102148 [Natribacillus halophilus]
MVSQRDVKQSKELVQTLLSIQGGDYNDWLHTQHQSYIREHQDVLIQSLLHYHDNPKGKTKKPSSEKEDSIQAKTDETGESSQPSPLQGVENT